MFRTAVLATVLALAVGQSASVLCLAWCDPQEAAAAGCHDQNTTDGVRLVGGDHCDDGAPTGLASLGEGVRRSAFAPHADHAIPVPRYQFVASTNSARPEREPGYRPLLETRPLVTSLRI